MPERIGTTAMMVLLALTWGVAAAPRAEAGQARSGFRAVLRIDADLVRRDLAQRNGKVQAGVALALATSRPSARTPAPQVLPRAGGGVCMRRWIGRDRFRWVCK